MKRLVCMALALVTVMGLAKAESAAANDMAWNVRIDSITMEIENETVFFETAG